MNKNNEILSFIKLQEQVLDLTIRIRVLETLLVKNNVIKEDDYVKELNSAGELISDKIKEAYKGIEELKDQLKEIKPEPVEEVKC